MIDTDIQREMTERETLIGLLPFYLSGEIEPKEAARVEAWLATDDEAPAILEKISEERFSAIEANEMLAAPRDGLSRLMADVAVTPQEKTVAGEGSRIMGLINRAVLAPLRAAPSELAWAACGLLMLVSIGQGVALYQGPQSSGGGGYELASGERADFLSMAVVKFSPSAAIGTVNDVLDEAGAMIVEGPTASGLYTLGFVAREGAPSLEERQANLQKRGGVVAFFELKDTPQPKGD